MEHSAASHVCHTCAMPGLCVECVDNCHNNHAVSKLKTECGLCLCELQGACLLHAGRDAAIRMNDEYSQLVPLFEMLLASSCDEVNASYLSTAADHYGYVVVQHILQRLRTLGAQSSATVAVPQILGKTLVKSASMRINKSGSAEVRCQPRHPHLPVVLALAAPYVWSMQHLPSVQAGSPGQEVAQAPLHPLGPYPLDRVVHPATLRFAAQAGLTLVSPAPASYSQGGAESDPWYSLLTRPAGGVRSSHGPGMSTAGLWTSAQSMPTSQLLCATPITTPPLFPAPVACAIPPPATSCRATRSVSEAKAWMVDLLGGSNKPAAVGIYVAYAEKSDGEDAPSVLQPEMRKIFSVTVGLSTGHCMQLIVQTQRAGAEGAMDDEAEEDYSILLCLLPLLLDASVLKCIPSASEAVMWLDACCGLKVVNLYDPTIAVDELVLAAGSAQGLRVRDWGETGQKDRSAFYSCRITTLLCEYLTVRKGADSGTEPAQLLAWVKETAQPAALLSFLYGPPMQQDADSASAAARMAVGCLHASAVLDTYLSGQGQVCAAAAAAVQGFVQGLGKGQLEAPSFARLPTQHRARLRSQLCALRVPPYDAFQRLVAQTRLLVPPWYLTCKSCGRKGHFDMDCPTVVEAWR